MSTTKELVRSLNQLTSLVVGQRHARATDSLKEVPSQRIKACLKLVRDELNSAVEHSKDSELTRLQSQAIRKLDALNSLITLAVEVEGRMQDQEAANKDGYMRNEYNELECMGDN